MECSKGPLRLSVHVLALRETEVTLQKGGCLFLM